MWYLVLTWYLLVVLTACLGARTRQALPEKPKPSHTAETDGGSSAAAEPVQPPMEGSPILEVS